MSTANDTVLADLKAKLDERDTRLAELEGKLSDDAFNGRVMAAAKEMLDSDPDFAKEFARKIRFGGDSVEKLKGGKYARLGLSVADVEFLMATQSAAEGFRQGSGRTHQGPTEELRATFAAVSGGEMISQEKVREMDAEALDAYFGTLPTSAFWGADRERAERGDWYNTDAYRNAVRAMDTAESGYGSSLVGAQYVGTLWEGARRDARILPLLETFDMTAPVAYLPVEADIPEPIFVAENTANNSSEYGTQKTGSNRVTVTAKKFLIHQMWSGEMEEDSIIPFIPFLQRQAQKSLAHYGDSLVLNGDDTNAGTGNINLDDADPADTKYYLAFDGIRHAAIVDNTNNKLDVAGAVSLDTFNTLRGLTIDTTYLMDWGHPTDPSDFVWVADPQTADRVALLDEVVTVDKYGPQAGVMTGEAAKILGHPLIGSIAMSKTEADGKLSTTGSNNIKGQIAGFNRRGFVVGWRRRLKLEFERLPGRDQTRLVYSFRMGLGRFTPTGSASGIESVAVGYDISL